MALNYTTLGDSVIYHNSMFLKKLSSQVYGRKKGWREKLGEFLESKPEQIGIFVLIVLDLLIICVQLFIVEPTVRCDEGHHTAEEEHQYEIADEVLDHVSTSILCVLALEMILLLIAFDVQFFKQPLYIVDGLVILASLSVDFAENWLPSTIVGGGSLLIFFRLWRIVRIVHGVAMSVQEKNEEQIKKLEAEVHKLTSEKTQLGTKFEYLKKRYKKLVDATKDEIFSGSGAKDIHTKKVTIDDDPSDMTPSSISTSPFTSPLPSSTSPFKSPGAPHYMPNPPPPTSSINHLLINLGAGEEEEDAPIGSFLAGNQSSSKDYNTFKQV